MEVLQLCLHHHFLQYINKQAVATRLTNKWPTCYFMVLCASNCFAPTYVCVSWSEKSPNWKVIKEELCIHLFIPGDVGIHPSEIACYPPEDPLIYLAITLWAFGTDLPCSGLVWMCCRGGSSSAVSAPEKLMVHRVSHSASECCPATVTRKDERLKWALPSLHLAPVSTLPSQKLLDCTSLVLLPHGCYQEVFRLILSLPLSSLPSGMGTWQWGQTVPTTFCTSGPTSVVTIDQQRNTGLPCSHRILVAISELWGWASPFYKTA